MNKEITSCCIIYHDKDKKSHREDGPAYISYRGTNFYLEHGNYNRIYGPARIFARGMMDFCRNNNLTKTIDSFIQLR